MSNSAQQLIGDKMIHTLRPGLLVSMQTSVKGNVSYHEDDRNVSIVDRSETTEIHTRKHVADIDEQAAAIKVRTKARGLILSVCSQSAFGLLCPNNREDDLRQAITDARKLADEFNSTATLTRMRVDVIFGRIAQDDVDAVRAIGGEVRGFMEDIQRGVKLLDVKMIRDAANKATAVGKMLSDEAKSLAAPGIEAGRAAARKIAKAGETAAVEIDRATIAKIDMARTSFLDLDAEAEQMVEPWADARDIDMEEGV